MRDTALVISFFAFVASLITVGVILKSAQTHVVAEKDHTPMCLVDTAE
jgi:hypothetical protein